MKHGDAVRIAKEIHGQLTDEDLKRYAMFVLDEAERGKGICIDFMSEEHPFIVEVIDSTRANEERRRFSFVVYRGSKKEKPVGLLLVDGLNCTKRDEAI